MQTIKRTLQCGAHCIAQLDSVWCLALRLVFGSLLVSLRLMAMVGGDKEGQAEEFTLPHHGGDGADLQVVLLLRCPLHLPMVISALATDVICSCH